MQDRLSKMMSLTGGATQPLMSGSGMPFVEVGKLRTKEDLEAFEREGRDPKTLMRNWSQIRTRCSVQRADGEELSDAAQGLAAELAAGVENGALAEHFIRLQKAHEDATWLLLWEHSSEQLELLPGMPLASAKLRASAT